MVIFLLWAETLLLVGRLQRDDCRTLRPVGVTGSGSWGAISGNDSLFGCRMTQGRCMVEPSNQSSLGARFRAAGWEEKPLQVAGAINTYTARLAEATVFRSLYLSGGVAGKFAVRAGPGHQHHGRCAG
jgi:hypothetical protein